jgi:hypothetical protein
MCVRGFSTYTHREHNQCHFFPHSTGEERPAVQVLHFSRGTRGAIMGGVPGPSFPTPPAGSPERITSQEPAHSLHMKAELNPFLQCNFLGDT